MRAIGSQKAVERAKSTGERVWWRLFSCRQCEVSEAIRWHYDEAEALGKEDWHALYYYDATALQYGTLTFHEQLQGTRDADEAVQQLLAFEKGSGAYDDFPDALEMALRGCAQHFPARQQVLKTPIIGKRRMMQATKGVSCQTPGVGETVVKPG